MANEKPHGKHAKIDKAAFEQDEAEQHNETEHVASAAETVAIDPVVPEAPQDEGAADSADPKTAGEEASAAETVAIDPVVVEDADGSDDSEEDDEPEQATVAINPLSAPKPIELPVIGQPADVADGAPVGQPGFGAASGELDEAAMAGFVPGFDTAKNKSRKAGKIVAITLGSIVGVIAIVYIAGAIAFSNWFLPNTTIGDMDVSLKSSDEVAAMLDKVAENYTLDVVGDGFSYRTDAKGLGLSVDSAAVVRTMHEDLNSLAWPVLIFEPSHDEGGRFEITFKQALYQDAVKAAVDAFNENATPPTNATIGFDEKSNSFKVVPESVGTQLDSNAVLGAMAQAIGSLSPKVTLGPDQLLQPKILSTDPKLAESAKLASGMITAKLTLNLAGQEVGTVNADELAQFITMNEETYEVTLDEAALDAWVTELASGYDTVGSERTYTRPDGKVVTVSGGVYGWEIDTEALRNAIIEGVKSGASATIDIPCTQEAAVYAGRGQQDWGARYVDVDLSEQYVRFYDWDGSLIWESACISGKPDGVHDTNTGVYVLNNKKSPEKLEGYENGVKIYTSYVTYWMPFVGNAIGLHDADWQPGFGGTMYADGYGSHGCVNLPPYAAAELFSIIEVGDVVVSHW